MNMRKNQIPKSKDNELIFEYVNSYAKLLLNYNQNKGIKQLEKHCNDLEKELLNRGFLTEEQIEYLNK